MNTSTVADRAASAGAVRFGYRSAGACALVTGAGLVLGFAHQLWLPPYGLWQVWTNDPLRSLGALALPTALWLALRNWSRSDWAAGGSWWGLLPIVTSLAWAQLDLYISHVWVLAGSWGIGAVNAVPSGLLFCAYLAGAVLLFGGRAALFKARFALLLVLFVNPVPFAFEHLVDYPLQVFAARTARGFAHLLAVPVSGDALKLMFAPQLGIFIAPGCNGLRSVTALGYMALVVGHLQRMSASRLAAYVAVAVVLAYAFNLLRLCCVIGYYWLALRIPALGAYGTQIDYLIGALVFVGAVALLLAISSRRLLGHQP